MNHLQVRMNKAEMIYFHSKLPDAARATNSEHLGIVFVFVWAYKIKYMCFENNFCPSLSAKSQKSRTYQTRLATSPLRIYNGCLDVANLYS